jgi:hypothetical protein
MALTVLLYVHQHDVRHDEVPDLGVVLGAHQPELGLAADAGAAARDAGDHDVGRLQRQHEVVVLHDLLHRRRDEARPLGHDRVVLGGVRQQVTVDLDGRGQLGLEARAVQPRSRCVIHHATAEAQGRDGEHHGRKGLAQPVLAGVLHLRAGQLGDVQALVLRVEDGLDRGLQRQAAQHRVVVDVDDRDVAARLRLARHHALAFGMRHERDAAVDVVRDVVAGASREAHLVETLRLEPEAGVAAMLAHVLDQVIHEVPF